MNYIYILTIILTLTGQLIYPQACGGGKFKIEFYTKNDTLLKYKITEVMIKDKELLSSDLYKGLIIDKENLKKLDQYEFKKNNLPAFISNSINNENSINNNELEFNTLETYNKLYLLKIWSKKNEVYILGNIFGGCNRKTTIIMLNKPIIIDQNE